MHADLWVSTLISCRPDRRQRHTKRRYDYGDGPRRRQNSYVSSLQVAVAAYP
jgi:hypothetical protein